jgi:hypothetical protein
VRGLQVSGLSSKRRSPAVDGLTAKLLPDRGATAGFFAGRLDMARVAVVGHRWGWWGHGWRSCCRLSSGGIT